MLSSSLQRYRRTYALTSTDTRPQHPTCNLCQRDHLSPEGDIWQCNYGHLLCAQCKEPGSDSVNWSSVEWTSRSNHRDTCNNCTADYRLRGWQDDSCLACYLSVDNGCYLDFNSVAKGGVDCCVTRPIRGLICGVHHSSDCGFSWHLTAVPEDTPSVACAAVTSSGTQACPVSRIPCTVLCTIATLDLLRESTCELESLPAFPTKYVTAMFEQVQSLDFALNTECCDVLRAFRRWLILLPEKAFNGICRWKSRPLLVRFADCCIFLSETRHRGAKYNHPSPLGPSTTSEPLLRVAHISSILHADAIYTECKAWCDAQHALYKARRQVVLQLVCKRWGALISNMRTQSMRHVADETRASHAAYNGVSLCRLPSIDRSRILWSNPLMHYEKDGAWHWLSIDWPTKEPYPLSCRTHQCISMDRSNIMNNKGRSAAHALAGGLGHRH